MIALIAGGVFILSIVVILALMLRAPRGREIPGVGFVRDEDLPQGQVDERLAEIRRREERREW